MAAPVPISVAGAQRSGNFKTSVLTYPGGYTALTFSLTGLGSGAGSDYENTALAFAATAFLSIDNGVTYTVFNTASWVGGAVTIKGVTDPAPTFFWPLADVPTGVKVYVEIDLTGTFSDLGLTGQIQ